jgi:hypothetical protein
MPCQTGQNVLCRLYCLQHTHVEISTLKNVRTDINVIIVSSEWSTNYSNYSVASSLHKQTGSSDTSSVQLLWSTDYSWMRELYNGQCDWLRVFFVFFSPSTQIPAMNLYLPIILLVSLSNMQCKQLVQHCKIFDRRILLPEILTSNILHLLFVIHVFNNSFGC